MWLAWFVGLTLIVLGGAEVASRVSSSEPIDADAVTFWAFSLCGGGSLILIGRFLVTRPPWVSIGLVGVGCLAGMVATAWTLVLPVVAGTLFVVTAVERSEPVVPPAAASPDRSVEP